jgi:hypothetical protein
VPAIYIARWAVALAVTLAVEVPLVAGAFRRDEPRLTRRVGLAVLASLVTQPALVLGLPWLAPLKAMVLLGGEVAAIALEAALYRWRLTTSTAKALSVSLGANAASFAAGALAHRATGWP